MSHYVPDGTTEADMRANLLDGFSSNQSQIILVDHETAGWIETESEDATIHLHQLHLIERWRNKGIGAKIIAAICRYAADSDRGVQLVVMNRNQKALNLYVRLGFVIDGDDGVRKTMSWSPPRSSRQSPAAQEQAIRTAPGRLRRGRSDMKEAPAGKAESAKRRRQIVAVISVDMTQYSWFMSLDELGTHDIARAALKRFESLLKKYGGRPITKAGDGLIAYLASALEAVQLATEFQQQMRQSPLPLSNSDIAQFRIGIHLADVIIEGADVHGTGVNIAKRLEGLSDPGGVLISDSVYRQIEDNTAFKFECIGECNLKHIAQAVTGYRLLTSTEKLINRPVSRGELAQTRDIALPSIAVLAFEDLSERQDQAFLCNALAQEITLNISKFKELFVISSSSTSLLKNAAINATEIAKKLGVRYIVEGSVLRAGSRLRIMVKLIDADQSAQVWSEKFERRIEDILDVQEEVSQLITARLAERVEGLELSRIRSHQTESLKAYGLLLQAQDFFATYTKEGNAAARRLYDMAIERDPKYARAYAGLSRTHFNDWRYLWSSAAEDSLSRALAAARKAVQLDPTDARGYAELAFVQLWSKELGPALQLFERAEQLNPNNADILAEHADALAYAGRLAEAEEKLHKAMRLNPFYPDWYLWYLADIYYGMERYADVVSTIGQMRDGSEGVRLLAASHAMLGQADEARRYARIVLDKQPDFSVSRWASIQPDFDPAVQQRFLDGLLRAGLPG